MLCGCSNGVNESPRAQTMVCACAAATASTAGGGAGAAIVVRCYAHGACIAMYWIERLGLGRNWIARTSASVECDYRKCDAMEKALCTVCYV